MASREQAIMMQEVYQAIKSQSKSKNQSKSKKAQFRKKM